MTIKYKKIGKRDHAFNEDKIKDMGHRSEGGNTIVYMGVCPMCDDRDVTLTANNYVENPVMCDCGAAIAFELDDIRDRDKTRKLTLLVWYALEYKGYSQAHRALQFRGT